MEKMSQVTVRISDADKQQVDHIVKELGLDMTTVTRAFYKQIIREQRVPLDFSLGLPAETEDALEESRLLAIRGNTKGYTTGKDLVDGVLATAGVDQ
ncbi:toxin-antitoxin system protein [Bifidobacterium asteroides PRL2011]|nr:type II toxin-antitoxin system RelB/DinJ family antitoxin [Bifidobacterium asteroides]AFU72151.1 toxin-antitoxin system protein [Bifidobacterium asteroides PRL2011]